MVSQAGSTQRLRRQWLRLHRWIALGLGGLLILSGITGAALVAVRPMDRWLHPDYFIAAGDASGASVSLESVRQKLATEFGEHAGLTFRPPREAGETLQVLIRGAWRGAVFLDPASGREQGRRGENEGFVNILYGLHSSLLMQETGKALLAVGAAAYLLLMVCGLALWWPRQWPPRWRIDFSKGQLRALFDLHRTGGVILGAVIAVSVATGAYLAWRPIGGWITAVSGQARTPLPVLSVAPGSRLPLDELAARALAVFPDGMIGYIMISPQADRPLRVRIRTADDPHPNGQSSVWLDSSTGKVLAQQRWSTLDPGTRINAVLYPLHTGVLGGVLLEIAVALTGLALAMLGISGIWLWWRRRAARAGVGRSL